MKKKLSTVLAGLALCTMMMFSSNLATAKDPVEETDTDVNDGGGGGTTCSVTTYCFNSAGTKVSCSSDSYVGSCERGSTWVECDNDKTEC
jgi:hypothetical protein